MTERDVATPCEHLRMRACHWCGKRIDHNPARGYWFHIESGDVTCAIRGRG